MCRFSRRKISKDIVELNSTISQLDIIDIYGLLHPTTAENILFSSSLVTFTNTDHILGHKTYLNTHKRIEAIPYMLLDHDGIKLESSNRKITRNSPDTWRLNNIF